MCSTKEPKRRRGTSPMVKSRSRVILARDIRMISLVELQAGGGKRRWASGAGESRRRNALDDLALEEQEKQDQRQGREQRGRHVLGVLDAVGSLDGLQPHGEGQDGPVVGGNEGPEEVVPGADEHEDCHGREDGDSGRMTWRKIRIRLAPSMTAASSSSRGIWSKNFLSTNTMAGWMTCGRMMAQEVSIMCIATIW